MKEQSVSKGFAILSAANIFVKILSFLYIPFLLGILTEEGYGIYSFANNVYVFVYVLANSGLPVAISKLVSELVAEGNIKDALRSFKIARSYLIAAGFLLGIILAITAGPVCTYIIKTPEAKLAILALAPALLFTSIASAYRGFFQGFGYMTPTAVSQVIEQVINTIATLAFAYLLINKGIIYACAGGTLGTTLSTLVSTIYLMIIKSRTQINTEKTVNRSGVAKHSYDFLARKIIQYSIPITLSVGLIYAGNLVDAWNIKTRLLVAGFNPDTANGMYGQMSRYISLMNVPIAIITSLSAAVFPAIAAAMATKDHRLVQNRISYAYKVSLMVSIPAAVGLSILSRPIYLFLKFGNGYELMMYGAIILIFMSVVQIQNSILQSSGKLFQVIPNLFIGIIIKIISNYVLIAIPQINIYGALIGSGLGYAVPLFLNHRIIKNSLKVKLKIRHSLISTILSAIAMALIVAAVYIGFQTLLGSNSMKYVTNAILLVISIIAGLLTYAAVLGATGGLTEEDLRVVPARFRKYIPVRKKG